MSSEARDWVWTHSRSRGTARLVLLSIADRVADEQCIAWASLASLATRANASRSTVRDALDRLLDSGELEQLPDLAGPQRSTVYRMPLAAKDLVECAPEQQEAGGEADSAAEPDSVERPRFSHLRRYGIRPREVPDSLARDRNPADPETGTSQRKPVPRRTGSGHLGVPDSGPQNRREPKVNRSSSSGAAVTSASQWRIDPATHTWTRQHGHLERLGEEGLRAADAKWRAHRASHRPRSARAWAADWRSWIAREHAPSPNSGALPAGMTRAEAHTAALLAALDEPSEPTGTEG
ncbi:helix-turn-helix domain-containing protein [Streptomyces buecherae]|uniref:helix-turn-helix domain-containing protein n=1 Tax=Streptomyces buecherae TaxID=2763006 RepID=UPI003401B5C1